MIHSEGSDLPDMGEWYAERQGVLIPDVYGEFTVARLVSLHNARRVFWTLLLTFGLAWADGPWERGWAWSSMP